MKTVLTPSRPRNGWMAIALAIAAAGLLCWAYAYMAGEHERARAAAMEVAECRSLAKRIETLRRLPAKQAASNGSKGELIQHITSAATAAGFDADALDRIEPEGSRTNGDGAASPTQARVYLKKVTLRQAVAFFQELESSGSLSINHLRFAAPSDAAINRGGDGKTTNTWTVEGTLAGKGAATLPGVARAAVKE